MEWGNDATDPILCDAEHRQIMFYMLYDAVITG